MVSGPIGRHRVSDSDALNVVSDLPLDELLAWARALRDAGHIDLVTYSPKVFIPLTFLCRDVCHYCTFAKAPRAVASPYMSIDAMVDVAQAGAKLGCKEALFTLGDQPEARYRVAREALAELGHETTLSYLYEAARAVHSATGLLPHLNPGVMAYDELRRLREVSVSVGIMLESAAERLMEKGGPHYGSPDKHPALRLRTIEDAGKLRIPFTTGILIGIGETRRERVEALLAIRALHERYGHIQEVIIQNFCPKPGTVMANVPAVPLLEHRWTIAVARIVFGESMSIQAPPNLQPGGMRELIDAGINDWGGVSPLTPDYVNPEAPWPEIERLRDVTELSGKTLTPRLPVYPAFVREAARWIDDSLRRAVLHASDAHGLARGDDWFAGDATCRAPVLPGGGVGLRSQTPLDATIEQARAGERLTETDVVRLFSVRGEAMARVMQAADALRQEMNGDQVTYVVNRNINYTNICYFKCRFCAFSKGRGNHDLRGKPYDLDVVEIVDRAVEGWERGATEVCMQGGIHPNYTGETYLEICAAVKKALPEMHVHAFSPLEVSQGARTLGLSLREYLGRLKSAGLGTLPGTAAEILDDEIRAIICPDKLSTAEWLAVMEAAHDTGFRTTATIMFGHVDAPIHWARHLLAVRDLQARTGGFTEFVPLPFVHMQAPMFLRGQSRKGPTFREAVLMHAVARLVLHPLVPNIQASWVKLGMAGVRACLQAGVNDLGGTLMNESISRSAGAAHGQELCAARMCELIEGMGRSAKQRTTLYQSVDAGRRSLSFEASPLRAIG